MRLLYYEIKWAASRKKGPTGNFDQNVYFFISWMCIILRLICEILSGIGFNGNLNIVYMEQRHLWQLLRHDIYAWTAQWLFEANFEILHCSCAFAQRLKHKPDCYFMQTRVIFYRKNITYYPLCVTRLKL